MTDSPTDNAAAFEHARALHAAGQLADAEQGYRRLLTSKHFRERALAQLADLYLQTGQPSRAADMLFALTEDQPDSLRHFSRLAGVLDQMGQTEAAIGHYGRLLGRQPHMAEAHFNLALLLKKEKRYTEALTEYREAIRLGIDQVEEVYSNIGVLYSEMRQGEEAREMYEKALDANPEYVPALYNLAGHFDEAGDRQRAIETYQRILSIDPGHWDALSRLAYATKVTSEDDELIRSLENAIDANASDAAACEGLYFALGKALDDVGNYEQAFAAYAAANALGKKRSAKYDPVAAEQAIDGLISLFSEDWLKRNATDCGAAPIFICGMFRSGSTLTEQILAAHSKVQAGGELDFLPWLMSRMLAPYPQRLASVTRDDLKGVADEYLSNVEQLFPGHENVTDKRPENFIHLGLIKAMFPSARIVYTQRQLRDNCLSVYFQQLGSNLSYAADLEDIAHYYRQQKRLLAHWQAAFGENLFVVDYDALVSKPRPVVEGLLEFLGLPWEDECLEFQRAESLVKTASVWQVRESLHTRSSGRWRNYEPYTGNLAAFKQDRN